MHGYTDAANAPEITPQQTHTGAAASEVNRETTNVIRYFLEEFLPPVVRDSRLMLWVFRCYWGELVNDLEDFRSRAHYVREQE